MAEYVQWSELFSIEVPKIDEEHKMLFAIMNDFYSAFISGTGFDHVFVTLNSLVRYAEEHFKDEEALMTASHYPNLPRHRIEHEKLLREIFDLVEKLEKKEQEIDAEVFEFIKNWLLHHILEFDKQLAIFFKSNKLPDAWA